MKHGDLTIGVGIPSYNHGRYIGEAIASVLQQTWRPSELLVIDDGSTDDSIREIEKAFERAGSVRCRLVVRENRGISRTRNELLAGLGTDVVALLDSDDRYREDRLERMLGPMAPSERFFAFSGVDFHSQLSAEETADWHYLYSEFLALAARLPTAGFALLRANIAITASNFVFSRALVEQVGPFDPRIVVCQDWDFLLRAVRYVEPRFVSEPLLTYRLHALGTARSNPGRFHEVRLLYEKLADWLDEATPNPLAPVPANWPGYLRFFAHICCASSSKEPLASLLPRGFLNSDGEFHSEGREALRQLLRACQEVDREEFPSIPDLLRQCEQAWTRP